MGLNCLNKSICPNSKIFTVHNEEQDQSEHLHSLVRGFGSAAISLDTTLFALSPSHIRPEFFYFLVLGKFLGKPSVGGGNKNKNKIQKFPESE